MKGLSAASVGGMESSFGGRKRENQPAMTRIHRGETQNVAKERAIAFRVFGVENNVSPKNYFALRIGVSTLPTQ